MSAVRELFNVRTPPDALAVLLERLTPGSAPRERVDTQDALDRVLTEEPRAPGELPTFPRSTMDGFAVRAADTFGATEGLPAYLDVVGEVFMGHPAERGPRLG